MFQLKRIFLKHVHFLRMMSDRKLVSQSDLFDPDFYRSMAGLEPEVDALGHYLRSGGTIPPSNGFDPVWYLEKYPDVKASGMAPLIHYLRYGRSEGRLPKRIIVQLWEQHLWSGLDSIMLPRLQSVLDDGNLQDAELRYAAWALARWYAWQEKWGKARDLLCGFQDLDAPFPGHLGPVLLASETLLRCGNGNDSQRLLTRWLERQPEQAELCLAQANLCADTGDVTGCLEWVNRPWLAAGLLLVVLRNTGVGLSVDNLVVDNSSQSRVEDGLRVSVIVPTYNAEATISTALRSLFEQTWRAMEILVVDDASSDGTWSVLQDLSRECPSDISIRLLQHSKNQGAYAARNTALSEACGDLITCHDSDDWSHPQKLAAQVQGLMDSPDAMASVSHWVRTTPQLRFHRWRIEQGWIDRNVSSLMFRRRVFEELGYWDRVSIASDTEYYYRIFAAFGDQAVKEVMPGLPLSFGRATPGSLSQHSATHEVSQFLGMRKDYMDAVVRWHERTNKRSDFYLSVDPGTRPFFAPRKMCRGTTKLVSTDPLDHIQESQLLDPVWYRYRYPDLLERSVDPLQHYWEVGASEGRDPGPNFSGTGYSVFYNIPSKHNPLAHYVVEGVHSGHSTCPVFEGKQKRRVGAPTVMICGHQAAKQIFGAERCLLDVAKGFDALDVNLVVSLPCVGNLSYLSDLREHAMSVVVLPYGWWMEGRPAFEETIGAFRKLFDEYAVDTVYLNTLVLYEPGVAAQRAGLPVVVHVHELPTADEDLCKVLNSDTDGVSRHLLSMADNLIANSHLVADYIHDAKNRLSGDGLHARQSVHLLSNTVDMERLLTLSPPPFTCGKKSYLTVGMLSSNLPKKGLSDFIRMSRTLRQQDLRIKCILFGPKNEHIDQLLSGGEGESMPANLSFGGYVAEPEQALAALDVVVNLSHCKESFGRTVLEAMTASRAVVCYDWGALPELVINGETGILIPFGEERKLVDAIMKLSDTPEDVKQLGEEARRRAVEAYGHEAFLYSLEKVVADIRVMAK